MAAAQKVAAAAATTGARLLILRRRQWRMYDDRDAARGREWRGVASRVENVGADDGDRHHAHALMKWRHACVEETQVRSDLRRENRRESPRSRTARAAIVKGPFLKSISRPSCERAGEA